MGFEILPEDDRPAGSDQAGTPGPAPVGPPANGNRWDPNQRARHPPSAPAAGGCVTVLGLWALIGGAFVVAALGMGAVFLARSKLPAETPGPVERAFPCERGGCTARMGGPGRWRRTPTPGAADPNTVLTLQCDVPDAALLVSFQPLERDVTPESAIASITADSLPNRRIERLDSVDVEIGGEHGHALHARISGGPTTVEGYIGVAVRNDLLFMVTALVVQKDFAATERELLAALQHFQLPEVERMDVQPAPAIALPPPPPASGRPAGDGMSRDALLDRADDVATSDPATAALLRRAAIEKGATDAEYDLARDESRAGHLDASIYWLQVAAAGAGVDPEDAESDSGLGAVRADPRWPQVRAYLRRMVRYWAEHTPERQLVTTPKSPAPGGARPVVIGMHGFRSMPEDFAGPAIQTVANRAGVGFLSLSATRARGPHSFAWTEDPALDRARLDRGLAGLDNTLVPAAGKLVALGFSQGAQMAVELAARDPGRFAGAIVMSPGTFATRELQGVSPSTSLKGRRFVVVVGAGESPGNVALAKKDADKLRGLGAEVHYREYEGVTAHRFPRDYHAALPRWIAFILEGTALD